MIYKNQISTKLAALPIVSLAASTNFTIHADAQLNARLLVLGFFMMVKNGENTLEKWALQVSKLSKRVFSKSAIHAILQFRQIAFAKSLLECVLSRAYFKEPDKILPIGLFEFFNQVFVEDSMCVKMPANLFNVFPGSHSKTGQAATARIQCRTELKTGSISRLAVQSFRDNDQKFAVDILHTLRPGDLVIRDLGYWSLKALKLIDWMKAFFLTRYRFGTYLYDADTAQQIDLHEQLQKAKKKGHTVVELSVHVGKKAKLPARLVAIKVPQNVEQQRRRKALKNRDRRLNHSKEYLELLGWTIFITNVPQHVWTVPQMLKVYGFRWRIEIIFKAWKSQFKFEHLFKTKQTLNEPRAKITLYFLLVWITLFFVPFYNLFLFEVFQRHQKFVSILKFANFFKEHFVELLNNLDLDFYIELVAKFCCYDRRKKIPNFCELLYGPTININ